MAFKMRGFGGFGNKDKRILRRSNRKLIKEQKELYKQGKITKDQFEAAKEEIKGYTDVNVAKEYLEKKK
tara:strand:+ start:207 stop:413 length:207 start_codon:yes stop_codon:yes gene_type:complete